MWHVVRQKAAAEPHYQMTVMLESGLHLLTTKKQTQGLFL